MNFPWRCGQVVGEAPRRVTVEVLLILGGIVAAGAATAVLMRFAPDESEVDGQ